jgi:hypothetical protein
VLLVLHVPVAAMACLVRFELHLCCVKSSAHHAISAWCVGIEFIDQMHLLLMHARSVTPTSSPK